MPMKSNRLSPFKFLAICYSAIVCAIALWAWYVDVTLLDSQREHLLPDILLMFCGLPSSLLLDSVFQQWPETFVNGLAQTAFLTVCALAQSGLVLGIAFRKKKVDPNA